nr:hypothetical protein [Sphingomonas sp. SCN 67-18]
MRLPRRRMDPIGPFPAMVVFALVLLLDIAVVLLISTAILWAGDRIEDRIWPGGVEWVTF